MKVKSVLASRAFVVSVIVGGCLLRIVQYLSGRSLWLDEAMISLNIIDQPFRQLFGALYYGQGAPPAWLFIERFAVDIFGSSEDALRLEPLLAGLASLPLFFLFARRFLGPAGAAAALCLFAVLNGPIIYSSEVKQYSDDVFFTLAVLTAVLVTVDRGFTRRWTIGLAVIGAVAMWFSHPVVFVLAGAGLTMIVQAVLTRDWGRLSRVLAVSATWAVSLGLVYLVNLRHIPRSSVTYYLPLPVSPHDLVAIARSFEELLGRVVSSPAASSRLHRGRSGAPRCDLALAALSAACVPVDNAGCGCGCSVGSRALPLGRTVHPFPGPSFAASRHFGCQGNRGSPNGDRFRGGCRPRLVHRRTVVCSRPAAS